MSIYERFERWYLGDEVYESGTHNLKRHGETYKLASVHCSFVAFRAGYEAAKNE